MTYLGKYVRTAFAFAIACAVTFGALEQAQAQTTPTGGKTVARPAKPVGVTVRSKQQVKAKPGFVLERGPANQLMVRRAGGGGGLGSTANCTCSKQGNCDWSASGDVAICSKSTNLPCNGSCEWGFTATGVGGAVMR